MFDFRISEVHAVLFTMPVNYRGNKFLSHFMSKWGDLFDGEPSSFDPPAELPLKWAGTFPRAILKSEDSRLRLQVAVERLDFQFEVGNDTLVDLSQLFRRATDLFIDYMGLMPAEVNRLASVVRRVATDEHAARTLSRRFCRDEWLDGPINRPSAFEIHTLKKYRLADQFDMNSWFRCKTATVGQEEEEEDKSGKGQGEADESVAIRVEQDLNTGKSVRAFDKADVERYFSLAPDELAAIFNSYFAEGSN